MNDDNALPDFRERGIAAVQLLQGVIYQDDKAET